MIRHRGKVGAIPPILRELPGIGILVHRVRGAAGALEVEGEEGVVGGHTYHRPASIPARIDTHCGM
jgi:hypothetical protein